MEIAIIGSRGFPSSYGGFETFVRIIAPYLAQKGHGVTVYGRMRTHRHRRRHEGDVVVIDVAGLESKSLSTMSHGLAAAVDAAFRKPDVALLVNVAHGFFLPALKARGIKTALNVDGL